MRTIAAEGNDAGARGGPPANQMVDPQTAVEDRRRVHTPSLDDPDDQRRGTDNHQAVTRPRTGVLLGRWYDAHGRHALPWRATRDRWLVLVSEVMLHQTQAPRVAQHYGAFVDRFPTPAAMAAAAPGDVIAAWDRLGYPRRARWLWEAAADRGRGLARRPHRTSRRRALHRRAVAAQVRRRRRRRAIEGQRAPRVRRVHGALVDHGGRGRGGQRCRAHRVRDRLLALMDVGATVCPRNPR